MGDYIYIAILVLIAITYFLPTYVEKRKGKKYKAIFDNVWEVRGYRTWMSLRKHQIVNKKNKPKRIFSNDKFVIERIGDYLFYKEFHTFGDYHKIWHGK